MQEIVESDLVFNISIYTSDDNLIFYSLPEQHSQPDVEVILEKMADVKRQQKTQKEKILENQKIIRTPIVRNGKQATVG